MEYVDFTFFNEAVDVVLNDAKRTHGFSTENMENLKSLVGRFSKRVQEISLNGKTPTPLALLWDVHEGKIPPNSRGLPSGLDSKEFLIFTLNNRIKNANQITPQLLEKLFEVLCILMPETIQQTAKALESFRVLNTPPSTSLWSEETQKSMTPYGKIHTFSLQFNTVNKMITTLNTSPKTAISFGAQKLFEEYKLTINNLANCPYKETLLNNYYTDKIKTTIGLGLASGTREIITGPNIASAFVSQVEAIFSNAQTQQKFLYRDMQDLKELALGFLAHIEQISAPHNGNRNISKLWADYNTPGQHDSVIGPLTQRLKAIYNLSYDEFLTKPGYRKWKPLELLQMAVSILSPELIGKTITDLFEFKDLNWLSNSQLKNNETEEFKKLFYWHNQNARLLDQWTAGNVSDLTSFATIGARKLFAIYKLTIYDVPKEFADYAEMLKKLYTADFMKQIALEEYSAYKR